MVTGTAVQFAVSVIDPPAVAVKFLKETLPVAPLTHLAEELVSDVDGEAVVPHFAVDVFNPLVTVQPVKV